MDRSKIDSGQKSLTVIVIGTRWGTLNLQVPRMVLVLSLVALVILVVLSLYALIGMVDNSGRAASKDTSKELKEVSAQMESAQKENARLKERVQSLENQFFTIGKKPPAAAADGTSSTDAKPFEASIDQFIIRHHPEDATYRFQFVLKASGLSHGRGSGYIFVILRSNAGAAQAYPPVELKNGRPQNYQSGDHFAISRQKMIKGMVKKIADPSLFQTASVLIYSEEGVLLLEKNYDLKGQ